MPASRSKVSCSKWGQKGGAGPDEENLPAVLSFLRVGRKRMERQFSGQLLVELVPYVATQSESDQEQIYAQCCHLPFKIIIVEGF